MFYRQLHWSTCFQGPLPYSSTLWDVVTAVIVVMLTLPWLIRGVIHNCQHLPTSTESTNLGEGGGLRRASVLFFKCWYIYGTHINSKMYYMVLNATVYTWLCTVHGQVMYPCLSCAYNGQPRKMFNTTSIEFTIFFLLFFKIVNSIVAINSLDQLWPRPFQISHWKYFVQNSKVIDKWTHLMIRYENNKLYLSIMNGTCIGYEWIKLIVHVLFNKIVNITTL